MLHDNITLARSLYAAVGAGDFAAVLASFAEDVEWTQPGSTVLSGVHRGRAAVAEFFLALLAKDLEVEALAFFGADDRVVVLTRVALAGMHANEVDVLTFRAGAVTAVEHIGDTEMLARALTDTAA